MLCARVNFSLLTKQKQGSQGSVTSKITKNTRNRDRDAGKTAKLSRVPEQPSYLGLLLLSGEEG